ncbi:hypothetical protein Tco_0878747 [Tanacetum coccineum]|uniref:Retrotransposon gag domain-containing protein n=1 Tax=Tanacetum coccineum TaxID=301880 RepID=A0ABQ5C266_9ASTR
MDQLYLALSVKKTIGKSQPTVQCTKDPKLPHLSDNIHERQCQYNEKTGFIVINLMNNGIDLSANLLRKALAITPVNPTHPFELPPSGDTVIDFVNELGYPEPVEIVSSIRTNYVYQPWRAILSLLNQCLTGKTSGSDKPRHPVLQMLWGIVTQTNVDHAELIWEEFTQGIQTFFSHKASHKASLKNPKKKVTPPHPMDDDYVLGNLKFVPKGESVEVFGMAIPDPLITEAIQQSSYYPKYLKMVAENTKKTPQGSASMQPATKRATPKKPTTTTPKGKPAFQLVDEEDEAQQESIPQREDDDPDLELAKKLSLETPQEKGEGEGDDADMERAIKLSLDPAFLPQGRAPVGGVTIRDPVSEATPKLHEVVGKGKAVVTEDQVAHSLIDLSKKKRTTDQFILARRDQSPPDSTTGPSSRPDDDTSEKVIHESSSTSDSERTESDTETAAPKGDKDQDEVDTSTVTSGVSIIKKKKNKKNNIPVSDPEKAHEALAGPDPEPMNEDQTGSDSGKLHVSLAGPNPEHMDDEFLATAYPKVHENLKLITDERVIDDKPASHSGSMSSMKNLDDTFNFGDQFLHDKPTEDDQERSKVREESDSTIPDSSHQTVTSTPPVIAPFTDVSSSEPSLLVTPPPINTEATTITTSLPEITPFIALQLRVARLEQEMSEVKKTDHSADVLASIRSQVPTAVDNYLGTKLDDALLKVLERHTADLIEKYSALPGPESVKNQESEKSPKEIIKAKKEQDQGFIGYPFDYRVTLGFGSIAGGLDHVNPVIRLPLEHGISRVLGLDDYSNPEMGDDVDINTLTLEQCLAFIRDDIRPGMVKPEIGNDVEFEINSNFIRELGRKTFSGTNDEDAHEHVRRVLEIVDLFHFPSVTHDAVMLRVFPITLKGRALMWKKGLPAGVINTWDLLEKEFIWKYCSPFKTAKKLKEIHNFK